MSTVRNGVYKCSVCGGVITALDSGSVPVCCGKTMTLLEANTHEGSGEKHVPVIKQVEGGYEVSVGSVLHPMEEAHYISFIQLIIGDMVHTAYLPLHKDPVVLFPVKHAPAGTPVMAREYCNLHGLWASNL